MRQGRGFSFSTVGGNSLAPASPALAKDPSDPYSGRSRPKSRWKTLREEPQSSVVCCPEVMARFTGEKERAPSTPHEGAIFIIQDPCHPHLDV